MGGKKGRRALVEPLQVAGSGRQDNLACLTVVSGVHITRGKLSVALVRAGSDYGTC